MRVRADEQMQEWIEKLADKSTEGMLTPEERDEYEALVWVGKFVAILQATARRLLSENYTAWSASDSDNLQTARHRLKYCRMLANGRRFLWLPVSRQTAFRIDQTAAML
jgi:hypothetical protein